MMRKSCTMETKHAIRNCQTSDLILHVKARNIRRFKPGAELSGKVNLMNVDFTEEIGEDFQQVEVRLHLSAEVCSPELN